MLDRYLSTEFHICIENQIQATLDKNTRVQSENQKYNWCVGLWQSGRRLRESTWRKESKPGLSVNKFIGSKKE